ncbi:MULTISPECIES: DMT family transporter [Ferroplasma]|jgi:drug/metabolite transporter (DMT)-like permease|nr:MULTISPECIES: DMT family transporter [Ferroplasma]MCL4348984.1 DMT family transporter [Candidatus Thermoplasmatota archaeon]WMT52711.1 MAG: DMT family transporter [Ferroplasma acidiphilum]
MLLISVVVIWGATFPIMKLSLQYISPVMLLSFRFILSAALMLPIVFKNKMLIERKNVILGIVGGILLFLAYYTQTVGLEYTTSSQSGLITGMYVVLLPIISLLYLKIKLNKVDVIAVSIGFIGLILMSSLKFSSAYTFGDILTFFCAIFYGLQTAYVFKYTKYLDSMVFTFYQLLMVGVLSSIFVPFSWEPSGLLKPIVIFTIVFTALFASFFAILINTRVLQYIEPTAAGVIYVGEPVFAVISSILILKEIPTMDIILGGIIIVVAMLIETLHKYVETKNSINIPQ